MTSKIYRTAQGKSVDLGTIMLQNEHVRAVGNMGVNARGDKIDNTNRVVETKAQQIQRQNNATTTPAVSSSPVHTSSKKSRQARQSVDSQTQINTGGVAPAMPDPVAVPEPVPVDLAPPTAPAPVLSTSAPATSTPASGGGLAGALARSREIKQELERTRRQQAQDSGVKKI